MKSVTNVSYKSNCPNCDAIIAYDSKYVTIINYDKPYPWNSFMCSYICAEIYVLEKYYEV